MEQILCLFTSCLSIISDFESNPSNSAALRSPQPYFPHPQLSVIHSVFFFTSIHSVSPSLVVDYSNPQQLYCKTMQGNYVHNVQKIWSCPLLPGKVQSPGNKLRKEKQNRFAQSSRQRNVESFMTRCYKSLEKFDPQHHKNCWVPHQSPEPPKRTHNTKVMHEDWWNFQEVNCPITLLTTQQYSISLRKRKSPNVNYRRRKHLINQKLAIYRCYSEKWQWVPR